MSECCSAEPDSNASCSTKSEHKPKHNKLHCPVCGQVSLTVPVKTILHHIKQPWLHRLTDQTYYYCSTPDCEVVYFAQDRMMIHKSEIRRLIGIKEQNKDALICFCFGVSRTQAASDISIKEFVIQQTKRAMCSCDTANPSGRCCLKDFKDLTDMLSIV